MQCKARTRSGTRCKAAALRGSQFCFVHDPQNAEARQVARIKGGHNRRTPARLSGDTPITIASMADVLKLLNAVILDSWEQDNSAQRSRVLLACCEVGIKALTATDLEQRIERLERTRGFAYEPGAPH